MFKVQVDIPYLAKGGTIEVDGLGVFEQGKAAEVDDATVEAYRRRHTEPGKPMRSLESILKGSNITITHVQEDRGSAADTNKKEGE